MKFVRIIVIRMVVIMKMCRDSVTVDKSVVLVHILYLYLKILRNEIFPLHMEPIQIFISLSTRSTIEQQEK
jgi:hypothetical protein